MHLRFVQHGMILAFLGTLLAALLYTLTHVPVFLRWPLAGFLYGTMAPYQGVYREQVDLRAEGMDVSGQWQMIDLLPYFPVGDGERIARSHLFVFRARGTEVMHVAYRSLAQQLRALEARRGHSWERVRLTWDEWPISSEGFAALRHPPFLRSFLLADVP